MGFNKKILPELDTLKEWFDYDSESLIRSVYKADALIGPSESIEWIQQKIKEYGESNGGQSN
jgi:hypothetical protein